jgi:5-methyltetrahydrofolate corrinoid/iron sulfur protein methyltransferase
LNTIIIIGEGIHVVSKEISEAIKNRNPRPIQKLALLQAEAGADYLDLNLGPLTKDATEIVQWVVSTVQEVVDLPLSIDTPNPAAMEAGLKICKKTPLINSASGMKESREKMLPLAQKYSANVIIMVINDEGLPSDANERATCMMEVVEYTNSLGIPNENIWIDGVLMPACVNQDQIIQYLEFIKMISDLVPRAKTVTGLSNISSCGTPKELRGILNRTFMAMISQYGQSAVIADVSDKELIQLNRGELPEVLELIYRIMDGEDINRENLSQQEIAYLKSVDVLMGKKLYSHSWLED